MSQPTHYATAPEDRIPFKQKFAYAMGMLVNNLQAAALPAMMVILILGLGMDPVLVGIVGSIPRLFDALIDPVVGHISDNTRSRWGRRRPYLFWGAIFSGIIFALMWQLPAGHSQSFYFWFFLIAEMVFFLAYAAYSIPLVAFGYEMTPDYHERTRLQAFANFIGQAAWLIAPWFLAIMTSSLFKNVVQGARGLAIGVGAFICIAGAVPGIFCRELFGSLPKANEGTEFKGVWWHLKNLFKGIGTTLKCRPFTKLCAATFLVFNGFQLGISFSVWIMIYYLFTGDKSKGAALQGWFGMITSVFTFGVIYLTAWISSKIGKRTTFFITISLSIVGYALKWVGYNPQHPYWLLAAAPFVAFGTGSLFTLMGSMIADVCDYDELQTHQRREGVFGAIYWWMVKVGMALAGLLSGILLKASGFITPSPDAALAVVQSAKTLFLLRVFDIGISIATSAIAIIIMATYTITEEKAHEIRVELEQRRGKLGS
jgi:GPH family glycoside/pentoside/hexuronide:cation symporter